MDGIGLHLRAAVRAFAALVSCARITRSAVPAGHRMPPASQPPPDADFYAARNQPPAGPVFHPHVVAPYYDASGYKSDGAAGDQPADTVGNHPGGHAAAAAPAGVTAAHYSSYGPPVPAPSAAQSPPGSASSQPAQGAADSGLQQPAAQQPAEQQWQQQSGAQSGLQQAPQTQSVFAARWAANDVPEAAPDSPGEYDSAVQRSSPAATASDAARDAKEDTAPAATGPQQAQPEPRAVQSVFAARWAGQPPDAAPAAAAEQVAAGPAAEAPTQSEAGQLLQPEAAPPIEQAPRPPTRPQQSIFASHWASRAGAEEPPPSASPQPTPQPEQHTDPESEPEGDIPSSFDYWRPPASSIAGAGDAAAPTAGAIRTTATAAADAAPFWQPPAAPAAASWARRKPQQASPQPSPQPSPRDDSAPYEDQNAAPADAPGESSPAEDRHTWKLPAAAAGAAAAAAATAGAAALGATAAGGGAGPAPASLVGSCLRFPLKAAWLPCQHPSTTDRLAAN